MKALVWHGKEDIRCDTVTDPETLGVVREWIFESAWPPIPPNRVGAVHSRGIISVFETATAADPVKFPIYHATLRGPPDSHAPIAVHVENEAWRELLDLIVGNKKVTSAPVIFPVDPATGAAHR